MALSFDSYLSGSQTPQQNQYLTGNPATNPTAQTDWMNPTDNEWKAPSTQTQQQQQPQASGVPDASGGTFLGAIAAGQQANQQFPQIDYSRMDSNTRARLESEAAGYGYGGRRPEESYEDWQRRVRIQIPGQEQQPNQQQQSTNYGNAPLGFDQAKWADPNAGNSLKYQVGRMAAQGIPIDQIASKVGAKVIAPDKIQYPDGFIADIYFDYGGPNQRVQYTDVTPGNSEFGHMQGNGQQPNFMQYLMQLLSGSGMNTGIGNQPSMGWAQPYNRQAGNQGNNPIGQNNSYVPWSTGISSGANNQGNFRAAPAPRTNPSGPINFDKGYLNPFGKPTPDANGYYGGWQDETGLRHSGNQPGMSYML